MVLLWLVLGLLVLDLAALLFAVDSRPGLEHSVRSRTLRPRTGRRPQGSC
jgi:hypothetical protein